MTDGTMPCTPIVELYDQLDAPGVGRRKRLALARGFVAVPGALDAIFTDSVRRAAQYAPRDEVFYEAERGAGAGAAVQRTHDLALRLAEARHSPVRPIDAGTSTSTTTPGGAIEVPADDLGFDYIDRELVPSRTTGGATHQGTAIRLDLLLANATDGTPIIAEVKIGADKDAFAALVQALAAAAQLASPAQRSRLRTHAHRERPDLEFDESGPLDVYVILHATPDDTFLPELREQAEQLSALLLRQSGVRTTIRRIACLLTEEDPDSGAILAYRRFAFERAKANSEG